MEARLFFPPKRRLEPWYMGRVADRLSEAIRELRSKGVSVSGKGRLAQAASVLQECAEVDAFPEAPAERIRVSKALSVAYDMVQVVDHLPDDLHAPTKDDLTRAGRGDLSAAAPNQAVQAQSQLYVGAILNEAGLLPDVPSPSHGRSPDFVIPSLGIDISLEVKRPNAENGIDRGIDSAVKQLEDFTGSCGGYVIVLDLSDLLRIQHEAISSEGNEQATPTGFSERALRASRWVRTAAAKGRGHERILALFALARYTIWRNDWPEGRFQAYRDVFEDACNGLVVNHAIALNRSIVRGMQELGAEFHLPP